jgi:hypothetical protein
MYKEVKFMRKPEEVLLAENNELLAEKESGLPSIKTEKPLT